VLQNGDPQTGGSMGALFSCAGAGDAGQLQGSVGQGNLATGLMVSGCRLAVRGSRVTGSGQGLTGEATGVLVRDQGQASLQQTTIAGHRGPGLVVFDAAASLDDCRVSDNGSTGVLVRQSSSRQRTTLQRTTVSGNAGAGVAVVGAAEVELRGGQVSGTRTRTRAVGAGTVETGDGLQVSGGSRAVVDSVRFAGNARLHAIYDGSGGSVRRCSFQTGVPALVLQRGARGQVSHGDNRDSSGAPVQPTLPARPYGL
jgi:hypothetical protein